MNVAPVRTRTKGHTWRMVTSSSAIDVELGTCASPGAVTPSVGDISVAAVSSTFLVLLSDIVRTTYTMKATSFSQHLQYGIYLYECQNHPW